MGDVFVTEDEDLCFGEARAVDNRGMIQRVGDDEIIFAQHSGNGAGIGGEAGLEYYAGFDILEPGDLLLEIHVNLHRAGDGAHGT